MKASNNSLQQSIALLFEGKDLSFDAMQDLFFAIIDGQIEEKQLAGVLIALKLKGICDEELTGAVMACLEQAKPFDAPTYPFADIVGTGGDGTNSINISTAAAIVASSLGFKIVKHGNKGVSSPTGSSDVLQSLGINVHIPACTARRSLDAVGLCFLFAPLYHQGFANVASVRHALKTKTIFNILGPLINPARPRHQLLGVYSPQLLAPYAKTCVALGCTKSLIVHGDGTDEVALHGTTQVAQIVNQNITYQCYTPQDFGLYPKPLSTLSGGSPSDNAQIIADVLQGNGKNAHKEAIAMNVALLMTLFGCNHLKDNTEQVLAHLKTDQAWHTLLQLQTINNSNH